MSKSPRCWNVPLYSLNSSRSRVRENQCESRVFLENCCRTDFSKYGIPVQCTLLKGGSESLHNRSSYGFYFIDLRNPRVQTNQRAN